LDVDETLAGGIANAGEVVRSGEFVFRPTNPYAAPIHGFLKQVRRVGNSNVVSFPREFEATGYGPGASVLVDQLEDGSLLLVRTDELRDLIRSRGKRLIASIARRSRFSPATTLADPPADVWATRATSSRCCTWTPMTS
jgi:hypothetical protein